MKRHLILIAVLVAVVASVGFNGVKTASAFNPQPEPPANPVIARWFVRMFPVHESSTAPGVRVISPIGADAQSFNPGIEHEDIGGR